MSLAYEEVSPFRCRRDEVRCDRRSPLGLVKLAEKEMFECRNTQNRGIVDMRKKNGKNGVREGTRSCSCPAGGQLQLFVFKNVSEHCSLLP